MKSHDGEGIHVVVNSKPDSPVYEVKPEAKDGRNRDFVIVFYYLVTSYHSYWIDNQNEFQNEFKKRIKALLKLNKTKQRESDSDDSDDAKVLTLVLSNSGNLDKPENNAPPGNDRDNQTKPDAYSKANTSGCPHPNPLLHYHDAVCEYGTHQIL